MTIIAAPGAHAVSYGGDQCLDIAFINNMPDSALRQTERQFSDLLNAGPADIPVRIWPYTLPGVARQGGAITYVREHYLPLERLWRSSPAAVVITGCEPMSADLTREPYWEQLVELLHWARNRTVSTIASCLAAHAAVLSFDGVPRRPLPQKCSGVYRQTVRRHDLTAGLPAETSMPHSRFNDVPAEAIVSHGYDPLIGSTEVGWTVAVREEGAHLAVLMQGHPEYDADTLLLEFRRDVRRYALGERGSYPSVPVGYFSPSAEVSLARFCDSAKAGERDLVGGFPFAELLSDVRAPWRDDARLLYANWLAEVRRRAGARVGA
jgi:homoserine O-succinyltransferase/O-acetyltransferase